MIQIFSLFCFEAEGGRWIDGAFSWWVTEENLMFSVKVQLWLQAAQGESSWLWHKSSGAIWLILLHLHKTYRGHKPPNKTPWVSGTSFFPNGPVFFSHAGEGTPLVSSTLILLLLFKSPHQPSLHPQPLAIAPNLWPLFLGGYCFCLWLTAHSIRQGSRCGSLAKESFVCINADVRTHQRDNTYNFGSMRTRNIKAVKYLCVICQKVHLKTKIIKVVYFPQKESFDTSQLQYLILSFNGFLLCLSRLSLSTSAYKDERWL